MLSLNQLYYSPPSRLFFSPMPLWGNKAILIAFGAKTRNFDIPYPISASRRRLHSHKSILYFPLCRRVFFHNLLRQGDVFAEQRRSTGSSIWKQHFPMEGPIAAVTSAGSVQRCAASSPAKFFPPCGCLCRPSRSAPRRWHGSFCPTETQAHSLPRKSPREYASRW